MDPFLILVLLFAQVQTSHFERLPYPMGSELAGKHLKPLHYDGQITIPKDGKWTLDYQKLYPGDYTKIPTRPMFRDLTNKDAPIFDLDESFDHITIQAKPGHKLKWSCEMLVPDSAKANP